MSNKKKKQAFDFARNSMWSIDPDDVCIIGGKALPPDERGPYDTDDGPEHDLYDPRILRPLREEDIANIDAHGVDTPIIIVKWQDLPTALDGGTRVRRARAANKRRKARGEPLIKVDAKLKRSTGIIDLMGTKIRANEGRRDDDIPAKIAKLKHYLNKGVSIEDAANEFHVGVQTIKNWLAYEDNAIDAVKDAVEDGGISQTTGAQLARINDPAAQKKALNEVLSGDNGTSTRAAKIAARKVDGTTHKKLGVTDKRTLKRFLDAVQNTAHHPNVSDKTLSYWEGVEEAIKLVIGDEETDARLVNKLDEVYSLIKTEKRASAKRATAK